MIAYLHIQFRLSLDVQHLNHWVRRGVYFFVFFAATMVPERASLFCRTCIACLVLICTCKIFLGHVIVYKAGTLRAFNIVYASCFSAVSLGGVTLH